MRTEIVYEDADVLVAYKCAGLATQSGRIGQADMVSELKKYLARTTKDQNRKVKDSVGEPYLGVVHRLDQPVEGLLVFGKTKQATAALSGQLTKDILNKTYLAVVYGNPMKEALNSEKITSLSKTNDSVEISVPGDRTCEMGSSGKASESTESSKKIRLEDYMIKEDGNVARIVDVDDQKADSDVLKGEKEGVKKAILTYESLSSLDSNAFLEVDRQSEVNKNDFSVTLVRVELTTGRFHQIRCQMAHAGFPLLGDQKYGTGESIELSKLLGVKNVCLCASTITFRHPKTGKILNFEITPKNPIFIHFQRDL